MPCAKHLGRRQAIPPRADSLRRSCELGIFVRIVAGNKAEAFRYGLEQGQGEYLVRLALRTL